MGVANKSDTMKNKFFTFYDYRSEAIQPGYIMLFFSFQQAGPVVLPQ
jgi:hypothetical protein